MANTEQFEPYDRTHRHIEALLRGERPERWPDITSEEADIVRVAGLLNGIGASSQPSPEFMRELAAELEKLADSRPRQLWARLTRRGLLRGVASVAGLLAAGAAADRLVLGAERPNPGPGWVAVARAADLAPGAVRRFLAGGSEGYLMNINGAFRAVSALCTHLPCVLDWRGPQRGFVCPCHQAEFDADGQYRSSPGYDRPLPPLSAFQVKQIGLVIYVLSTTPVAPDGDEESEYRDRP